MTRKVSPSSSFSEALTKRGYVYSPFELNSELFHRYAAPNGWNWIYGKSFRTYPFIAIATRKISSDKLASYEFARMNNVTIPHTMHTADQKAANGFLADYKQIVVKPLSESGGAGLTVGITNKRQLKKAMKYAAVGKNPVLLQEQFIGQELRFTIVKGKVASIILRQTPRIVGNGKDTIAALIKKENEERSVLVFPELSYPLLSAEIIDKSLIKSKAVPSKGEVIELSKSTMIRKGASFLGVTKDVHASYSEIALRLANALSPALLIVDLMVTDYTIPATDSNYVFLEFNTAPGPKIYSSIRSGDQPPIIDMVADLIDEYSKIYGPK